MGKKMGTDHDFQMRFHSESLVVTEGKWGNIRLGFFVFLKRGLSPFPLNQILLLFKCIYQEVSEDTDTRCGP